MTKRCKHCNEVKESTAFYVEKRVRDGLSAACRACGVAQSRAWQNNNRDKYNAIQARWRNNNRGVARERQRAWCKNNPERAREFAAKWRNANQERCKARIKAWGAANKTRLCLYQHARRARYNNASGTAPVDKVKARIAVWGNRCWVCSGPYTAIDHVIPLKKGGTNWPANLRPICKPCNSSKGVKHPLYETITTPQTRKST